MVSGLGLRAWEKQTAEYRITNIESSGGGQVSEEGIPPSGL
ncbi:hypothetical protein D1BOALGB6SA_7710 [Olavius sp. associated proteobacterium Delta 1]|nr:hypothetical protein D1BOALGB6SA_7710 [Olavius sp. associated proteobacterium Delta 1]